MNRLLVASVLLALVGCRSYNQLKQDVGQVKVDGQTPVATYEVVNVSYKLLGIVPLTTGVTWKEGPYEGNTGSMKGFADECSLDDNLDSVRHACEIVGADKLVNVTGQVDEYWAWSLWTVKKRIVKTSCVITR